MKKLIQICSILSLLFVFTAVSAYAQSAKRYEAQIPFDFNIGQKAYQAGTYVIKVTNLSSNGSSVAIEDKEGNKLQTILVLQSGNVSKNGAELVFNRYENQRFLTKILTQDAGVSIAMSGTEKQVAGKSRKDARIQVALTK